MNDYCFISCYFISFKIKSNRYNLNVKYWIGYRYRQISVIKNRNIGISVFSRIGASLLHTCMYMYLLVASINNLVDVHITKTQNQCFPPKKFKGGGDIIIIVHWVPHIEIFFSIIK